MFLYIFAGADNSGKTFYIENAREGNFYSKVKFISYNKTARKFRKNINNRDKLIKQKLKDEKEKLLNEKQPMFIETLLIDNDDIDFLKKAKLLGYKIFAYYFFTFNFDINIEREENGTAPNKIRSNYIKSLENFGSLYESSDILQVMDSISHYNVIFYKKEDCISCSYDEIYSKNQNIKEYIAPYFIED